MAQYENILILRQDVTSQQVETMIDTYKGVIEQNGGRLEKIEMWGVKSLAYRIKKNRKAHFALLNIDAPPAAIAEMERQMQISEDVLRFMTVRVGVLDSPATAATQQDEHPQHGDSSSTIQSGLNIHSSLILSELRKINEDIEARISRDRR